MSVRLIDCLSSTEPLAELFSDASIVRAMFAFESALARAESKVGIIPGSAADTITAAAKAATLDVDQLSRDALRAGTPSIPLVKALTEIVRKQNSEATGFVHWGATSQDVSDTAFVILLKSAQPIIQADLRRCEHALRQLSENHKDTILLGRTLLQPAPPITFGLKAAGWYAAVRRGHKQLSQAFEQALVLQFGGAAGTLASLGDKGLRVAEELASELGLRCPDAPWHAHRDRLAALVCACGVVTGSLGKVARDISLLMQEEVGEVAEPASQGRGGSSTMPQKRNPVGCAVTLAAASRTPGLVAAYLSSMVQEHERSVGGIQSEWPTLAAIVQTTSLATASIAEVAEGLTVNVNRMGENIEATRGSIFAERAMVMLGTKIGRDKAHHLLQLAAKKAAAEKRQLTDVLAEMPEVAEHLDRKALQHLSAAREYLGSAESFRQQLLAAQPAPLTET